MCVYFIWGSLGFCDPQELCVCLSVCLPAPRQLWVKGQEGGVCSARTPSLTESPPPITVLQPLGLLPSLGCSRLVGPAAPGPRALPLCPARTRGASPALSLGLTLASGFLLQTVASDELGRCVGGQGGCSAPLLGPRVKPTLLCPALLLQPPQPPCSSSALPGPALP